jgi:hypothetical protein
LIGNPFFAIGVADRPAVADEIPKLAQCSLERLFDADVLAGDLDPPVV